MSALAFCKVVVPGVKIGKIASFSLLLALVQLDCGAHNHGRHHRLPHGRPGGPPAVRRSAAQRTPAPPLRRIPHRTLCGPRKNVCGINRAIRTRPPTSPASTASSPTPTGTPAQINQRRLEFLQQDPSTRYCAHGVIPIDNTLIDHVGQLIEDAGWFWDHAEERLQDRPRLLDRQLRLHHRQALPAGLPPLSESKTCVRPWKDPVQGPHRLVPGVDRLGVRRRHPRHLRLRQLLHQCAES